MSHIKQTKLGDGVLDDLTSPSPWELAEPLEEPLELLAPRFLSVALVDELSASLAPRELPTTSREGTFLLQLEVVARRIFPKTGIPDELRGILCDEFTKLDDIVSFCLFELVKRLAEL